MLFRSYSFTPPNISESTRSKSSSRLFKFHVLSPLSHLSISLPANSMFTSHLTLQISTPYSQLRPPAPKYPRNRNYSNSNARQEQHCQFKTITIGASELVNHVLREERESRANCEAAESRCGKDRCGEANAVDVAIVDREGEHV